MENSGVPTEFNTGQTAAAEAVSEILERDSRRYSGFRETEAET